MAQQANQPQHNGCQDLLAASKLWKSFPPDICILESITDFKTALKPIFLSYLLSKPLLLFLLYFQQLLEDTAF